MNRTELISTAKEMGLTFERPATQVKSEIIEAAIKAALEQTETAVAEEVINELPVQEPIVVSEPAQDEMPDEVFVNVGATTPKAEVVVKEKKIHIYDEILNLALTGISRTAIFNQLKEKHPKLNYRYVVQTLLKAKAAGVELDIPRQERVFTPKADAIEALEAKLAKMKEAAAAAVVVEEPIVEVEVPEIEDGTEE